MAARLKALPRFIVAVSKRFIDDRCLLHASGLAYTTLLSLVPLLALMFSILKGLGVQRRLEPLLLSRLALSPETTQQIIGYIDQTNVGTLGTLGAALLVLTVISVLGAVEASLNHIWRVRQGRTYWRKVTDYLSAFLLAPMLLLAAMAVATTAQEERVLDWIFRAHLVGTAVKLLLQLAPIVVNAVAIGALYALMPNRRPYVCGIALGALVAGAAWYGVQWTYVALQVGVARYNAIYGAMAQLPVTLVWIYISWAVVLAGAEVAAVYEFGPGSVGRTDREALRWPIAAHVLLRAAEAFRSVGPSIEAKRLAQELEVETDIVSDLLERLRAAGFLAAVDGGGPTYVLSRDPSLIALPALAAAVDPTDVPAGCDRRVRAALERLNEERQSERKTYSLADLMVSESQR